MLDINFIRDNKDIVKEGARKKHVAIDIDVLISLDDKRRELTQKTDDMRARQNVVSQKIAQTIGAERDTLIADMQTVKVSLQTHEDELKKVMEEWRAVMLQVPNVPDISVPDGNTDADNQEIRVWGEKPKFEFTPKSHTDIMLNLDMVDFERGAKVHGFRGYFLKNDGALLSWAIWNYARDFFMQKGFQLFLAPTIVKKQHLYGTGHLPNDVEDIYATQDEDYLSGTAEIPMMGFHSDEVLDLARMPIKYLAFSPCYRREIGSYGKDTKGLIRVHEFYKFEQLLLCEASHEESVKWHEWLTRNTEEFIESLNIPYHTVVNCGGDLGLGQVKKYDIEAWVPLEQTYREVSSASYFHDFQCRRFNIKYTDAEGKKRFAHSLNNTAIATPRVLVSLIENYQQADGSVVIPEVLRQYMGGREKIEKK